MIRPLTLLLFQSVLVTSAVTLPPGCTQEYMGQTAGSIGDPGAEPGGQLVQDSAVANAAAPDPVSQQTGRAAAPSCPSLLENPPRGLSCLHCTFPAAKQQADEIVSILTGACISNVAIAYLVDGTFGFDPALLRSHISQLTADGRTLFLHLYLLNGPGQRRWHSARFDGTATSIPPAEFRERIQTDEALRREVVTLVERLVPLLREATQRGAFISIVPMLEDNLDARSFKSLAELVKGAIPADIRYELGRNPCKGCSRGADGDIPEGLFAESHSARASNTPRRGVLSNDGHLYCLDESCADHDQVPLRELQEAARRAAENQTVYLLWTGSWQGVVTGSDDAGGAKTVLRRPEERQYPLPTPVERSALIRFLRDE